MIIDRVKCFYDWLDISESRKQELEQLALEAAMLSEGMTHLKDYLALGAILEAFQPKQIFEIGTYKGVTSDFFLQVLPHCKVLSIAYINPKREFFKKRYNNSELSPKEVGSYVHPSRKERFIQIYGNSHQLIAGEMVKKFGLMDLIFIDGDHSLSGVRKDTQLALQMIHQKSTLCWHDANPKERYALVRNFLEQEVEKPAIATYDNYIGGVACWNHLIEEKLRGAVHA